VTEGPLSSLSVDDDDVLWAIQNFLMYAQDQLGHLESENIMKAAYVGRHLDQAWRTYEFAISSWLNYSLAGAAAEADQREVLDRLKRGASKREDAQTLMGRLLYAAADTIHKELTPAVEAGDRDRAAVAAYLARRWFTKYRVLKWRWLERHRDEVPAYQLFEA
jgi:hypothetical protein